MTDFGGGILKSGGSASTGLRAALEAAMAEDGLSMGDMTVLAPANDPFRVDTAARHRDGEWLAMHAEKLGDRRIHLRGLHYMVLGEQKPDGTRYTNTDPDWLWLSGKAGKAARWLGYIPFDRIADERNTPPVIRRFEPTTPEPFVSVGLDVEVPSVEDLVPVAEVANFYGRQPYKLVLFGEKTSLEPVLAPIAEQRQADLYLPTGEASDTMIYTLAETAATDGRPVIVFYLSDCDPAGWQMAVSVARKLQAFKALLFPDLRFELRPVALTPYQVREYGLPSTPLKETEKRADKWKQAMGVEQTEIDSIATLQPELLDRLVRQAIKPFYDPSLANRVAEAHGRWKAEAQQILDSELDQGRLAALRADASDKLGDLEDQISYLNQELQAEVPDGIDLPAPIVPEAEITAVPDGKPLIASEWDYIEQTRRLIAHKAYENGGA